MLRFLTILAAAAFIAGCAHTATYNASHFAVQRLGDDQRLDGRALILTESQDDAYTFSGKPTSFTGGGTTLTIPLGLIAREAATLAFGDLFRGGVDKSNDRSNLRTYAAVVSPRVTGFSYEYNALKNVGFAITPTVVVSVSLSLLDEQGKSFWEKTYESGSFEGDTYVISGSPGEDVGKAAHRAIYGLMLKAAGDAREQVKARPRPRDL